MQCRVTYTQHPLLETGREYAAHLHLKPYSPKQLFFRHTPKMTFSSCNNKWSVGYLGLNLHRHILGTPKINITSCKKGHNRCPLIHEQITYSTSWFRLVNQKYVALVMLKSSNEWLVSQFSFFNESNIQRDQITLSASKIHSYIFIHFYSGLACHPLQWLNT